MSFALDEAEDAVPASGGWTRNPIVSRLAAEKNNGQRADKHGDSGTFRESIAKEWSEKLDLDRGDVQDLISQVYGQLLKDETAKEITRRKAKKAADADEIANGGGRKLLVTRANTIKIRPVFWLYEGRLPLGCLSLIAGQGGLGKSTVCYAVAAAITKGKLPGSSRGNPRSVIVVATEDSWEHTIVPRLMAHSADLEKVLRVDALAEDEVTALSLPVDVPALRDLIVVEDVALVLLDPLTSRLEQGLDSHKDAEVRTALEPLSRLAQETNIVIWGIMHHNKSGSSDPMKALMASAAFGNVARAVHTVLPRPGYPGERVFGISKNNLGRTDLPTLIFRIETWKFDTEEGPGETGKLKWLGETSESVEELMVATDVTTTSGEAAAWLKEYLVGMGGSAPRAKIIADGAAAGHNEAALGKARKKLGLLVEQSGFPKTSIWCDPPVL